MRKYIQIPLFFYLVLLVTPLTYAQQRKLDRGDEQYHKYEYINAQKTYLKVVEKGYKSADLYKKLGNSYYFNSQFEEALKWYEALVTTYPNELESEYLFRYAQTLKAAKRYEESDRYMEQFTATSTTDQRGKLYAKEPDYLERIDFQSGRYEIENLAINSSYTDFGAAFYDRFVVFSSTRDTLLFKKSIHQWNDEPFLDLYQAEYNPTNGELSEIKKLQNKLNSKFHESTPIYTKDLQTVYFTRNNYDDRRYGKDKKGTNRLKVYRSYKNAQGGWTTPQSLPFNSDEYSVAHPALSVDEKTLYFSSDMPGGTGLSDIYSVSINSDGSFGAPQNLGTTINTEGKETFPFISAANDLYFASDGHTGLGGLDVYVTRLNPKTTEEALIVNIGKPINSPKDDFAFIVDINTKRGYFSSNRDGGKGKDDIYTFLQLEDVRPFCEITIAGVVTDKDTNELLPGAKVTLLDSNNTSVETITVGDDAAYTFTSKCNTKYFVRVDKEQYLTEEKLVETPGETTTIALPLPLENELKSAQIGDDLAKLLALNRIYFDFDQAYIRKDAAVELAKVIAVLNEYPKMKIEVGSHTDSHGDDTYNLILSERRAKATVAYMVKQGIAADRLTGKGYGETQHVNVCGNDQRCTKDEHQLNRRSEFIIVK